MSESPAMTRPGAGELPVTFRLAAGAWVVMALQEVALFLRPTPYGGPYVQGWLSYLGLALFYNMLAAAMIALPFALRWWLARRATERGLAHRWHRAQLGCLVVTVGLDHADNEVMRFLGTHLTITLLRTYEHVGAWGSDMLHVFTTDRGGPGVSFVLLAAGMGGLWWWGTRRIAAPPRRAWSTALAASVTTLPVLVPLIAYNLPGGHFPRNRVRPAVLTVALEAVKGIRTARPPADLDRRIDDARSAWRAGTADSLWRFDDSAYPLHRTPVAAPTRPRDPRRNFIYLQLETFRGWNVGALRPDDLPSATPFLDSLIADPATAWWSRALSFGPPTPSGFFSGHCSAPPHSERFISTVFTTTRFHCFPELLRRHGYRAIYVTGSDPDWDNQAVWLRRWYDSTEFYRDADELDRVIFRRAAERIQSLGRSGQPFLATVVSISNHYPFRSREPALDLGVGATPGEAVRNTMRYTDDVVREFVDALRHEPWFERTVLIIVGDHGYNLGEHDGTAGQRNAWRESTWVPLVVHAHDPRLAPGRHDDPASLLDVAPTVADLAGLREAAPWLGRSLLAPAAPGAVVTMARHAVTFAETERWSLVLDPASGEPRLYEALSDPLQRRDLAAQFPDTAAALLRLARERQALWDYLVEANRVLPPSADSGSRP